MAISIEWQTEDGTTVLRYSGPDIDQLQQFELPDSRCLEFLDPYGDLTLNRYQISVLEQELNQVLEVATDSKVRDQASAVLKFVAELGVDDRTHQYLKFIGD